MAALLLAGLGVDDDVIVADYGAHGRRHRADEGRLGGTTRTGPSCMAETPRRSSPPTPRRCSGRSTASAASTGRCRATSVDVGVDATVLATLADALTD